MHKWYVIVVVTVPSPLYLERNVYFMELIVISHTKIKIMLTKPDMAYYELSGSDLNSADEHTRRAVRHILSDADRRVGFDTEGERLFVQFFASKDGGCEIFVTKLGKNIDVSQVTDACEERLLACVRECESMDARDGTEDSMPLSRSAAHCLVPCAYTGSLEADPVTVVCVEEMSTLLSLCRRLLNAEFDGESTAYINDSQKKFYLCLHRTENADRLFPFLAEYGSVSSNAAYMLYIDEHARLICEKRAVQVLGVL